LEIPLPPKFDVTSQVEDEFLTPPIWVASNPPPLFERPEMKRTMSDMSNWEGDEDESASTTTSSSEMQEVEEAHMENVIRPRALTNYLVSATGKTRRATVADILECETETSCSTDE